MELITARATKAAREVQTKYGPRYVVECELLGTEQVAFETIWAPTDMEGVGSIKHGQQFLVGRHRSGKLSYVDSQPEAIAAAPARPLGFQTTAPQPVVSGGKPAPSEAAGEAKAAIAADAVRFTRIYAYCYQQALESMPGAPAEAIQACASSAWIAIARKHQLS